MKPQDERDEWHSKGRGEGMDSVIFGMNKGGQNYKEREKALELMGTKFSDKEGIISESVEKGGGTNDGLKAQEKGGPQRRSDPYGFYLEDFFQHSTYPVKRDEWLWIPKGHALHPELGFQATKRDVERFGGGAIRIKRQPPPQPLIRSFLELVMNRDLWRGIPRGQKRPAEGLYDRFGKPMQGRSDGRKSEEELRGQLFRQNEDRRRMDEEERRRREDEERRQRDIGADEARRRDQGMQQINRQQFQQQHTAPRQISNQANQVRGGFVGIRGARQNTEVDRRQDKGGVICRRCS